MASEMMSRFGSLVSLLLFICLVISCDGSSSTPKPSPSLSGLHYASLTVGSLKRTYRLFIPSSLDPKQPPPLVVALPGCPSVGDNMAEITHLDGRATSGGFVIVYPDPVAGCWNTGTCCGTADDIPFISALLDRLTTDLRVDKKKVFAAGWSRGAIMAYRLACEFSNRILAIASVAGEMDLSSDCRPTRPVSILEMHGTDDSNQQYDQGANAVQQWVKLDGCSGVPTQSVSGITKTSIWSNCSLGSSVRFDTVIGGHDQWFGSNFDPVDGEPNANATIWDFFSSLTPRP